MIHGTVVGLQARIGVILRLPGHSDAELECVVDTGFEGYLTLPPSVIAELGLPYLSEINANLADNTDIVANAYLATIVWRGVERNIAVLAMGRRPLVGTALLEDYHLSIDFCEGGSVLIDDIL
ncbi:clan AA aspartic protease [Scytonema hofmannii FACHB-248]|uniref:Clan AA aspartic protease n=1 Tax=Scytonema hofmannii FACHB-248 TaxID=1842502 RepID=A0ABR8GLZ8_9CYAN|nr:MULTISPECIES: clan AA aspartic protease [Nostocales]MBD2604229.1 clan AA aspartic protease [Scytonema hofmannii FACHB-248]